MSGRASDPIVIPDSLWQRPQMTQALTSRDIRAVFHLLRQYTGASQTQIAIACGMTQGKVSETMKKGGRQVTTLEVFERIADGLHMPDTARMTLGIAHEHTPARQPSPSPAATTHRDTARCLADAKPAPSQTGELAATDDISRLTRWLTVSDTTDETIEDLHDQPRPWPPRIRRCQRNGSSPGVAPSPVKHSRQTRSVMGGCFWVTSVALIIDGGRCIWCVRPACMSRRAGSFRAWSAGRERTPDRGERAAA